MKLGVGQLRPGKVLEIVNNFGVIKASCCGLFSDQDAPENLPPIYPFQLSGVNTFNSIEKNDEVWVLSFEDNPYELLYIRKDNLNENLNSLLSKEYKTCDVLASRDTAQGMIQLYFTDGDGWIIRNIDSVIQIRKDGSILLDAGSAHRKIDISDDSISLGSIGSSAHTGAYGDKIVETFNALNKILKCLVLSAKQSPFTCAIGIAVEALLDEFENAISQIESPHVTLD